MPGMRTSDVSLLVAALAQDVRASIWWVLEF
jgi:hypothetical protein